MFIVCRGREWRGAKVRVEKHSLTITVFLTVKEQFLTVMGVQLYNGWSQMDKGLQYINYIVLLT